MSNLSDVELTVLRQISETLNHLNTRMENHEAVGRQILQRVVIVEERSSAFAKLESRIEEVRKEGSERLNNHSSRIASLEASRHRVEGASHAVEWTAKILPAFGTAFLGAALALAAYLGINGT